MMTGVRPETAEQSNDILVAIDLLNEVIADYERLTVDEAILLRHSAEAVRKKAVETIAALDLHLVDVMEWDDAVNYKGWQYRKGLKKDRERFDHDEIAFRVRKLVCGLIASGDQQVTYANGVAQGAAEAIRIMRDIYLSDSTKAKTGQLDRYGIPRDRDAEGTVRHWEKGDVYIDVSPIQSQVQQ